MGTILWTMFAVAGMLGMFAGCVLIVVAAIRMFEAGRDKRPPGGSRL